jgi:hypothetical protein
MLAFNKRNGHNMLVFMFNPRFLNIQLVTRYLGCENVVDLVVEYDENLLLPFIDKNKQIVDV